MADINDNDIEELLRFARLGLVSIDAHTKRLDDLEAAVNAYNRRSEANAKRLSQLETEYDERIHELETLLSMLQYRVDLLANKFTTGGLGKSIAQIDQKLEAMSRQRASIHPIKTLSILVTIAVLIVDAFSLEEMDDLIFQAGGKVESVPTAKTAPARAREIVDYFEREGQLVTLLAAAKTMRPEKLWPTDV